MNAPIILTDGNILSPQAQSQLNQLAPSRIVIAGGASAISNTVMNSLKNICPNVQRVAGETRVDTSLNLYREGSGWGSTVLGGVPALERVPGAGGIHWLCCHCSNMNILRGNG